MFNGFLIFFLAARVMAGENMDDYTPGTGRNVCLRLEALAANPEPMLGKSADEIQDLAQRSVQLMHKRKVDLDIDRIVADAGGAVQIISKLSGSKGGNGPMTLSGSPKKLSKKLNQLMQQGGGDKLKSFVQKKLASTLSAEQDADEDVLTLMAHVTAHEVVNQGVSKLAGTTKNVDYTPGTYIPGTGHVVCLRLEALAANPEPMLGKSADDIQDIAQRAVQVMHNNQVDQDIDRIVAAVGGPVQIVSKLSGSKGGNGAMTLSGSPKTLSKKLNQLMQQGGGKLKSFVQKKLASTLSAEEDADQDVLTLMAHVTANEVLKQGVAQLTGKTSNEVAQLTGKTNNGGTILQLTGGGGSKKTLCLFSPPREYCVAQTKDAARSQPELELNPPDYDGVADGTNDVD